MVSEGGLVKAMNKAYGGTAGYTVAMVGNLLYIQTEEWEVLIRMEKLPRKALALIVEHIGSIPKDGEAYKCSKKGGAQLVAVRVLREQMQELMEFEPEKEIVKTNFLWEGNEVWQEADTLGIVGLRPEYTGIIDKKESGTAYRCWQSVLWEDGARVRIGGARLPPAVVQHLSAVRWIGGKD